MPKTSIQNDESNNFFSMTIDVNCLRWLKCDLFAAEDFIYLQLLTV